ncbi:hypothetical protein GOP47_0004321 [Adiantum capillus-veneris]|uniref:Glycerol-3-phosphate dehydrogenase [NAD(+)] n=1 Tax=Adiantum capillus-veneris TaxID=13818 RepID=A0A9D4V8N1_ADICA|nr:hypothetical protein GOP47_0004321 [Adiantum capillus-veneris]
MIAELATTEMPYANGHAVSPTVNGHANGHVHSNGIHKLHTIASPPAKRAAQSAEERLTEFRSLVGKADGDPLRIVGVGAGAWGSVFVAMLQDAYGYMRDKVQIRIWRREKMYFGALLENVVTNLQEAVWDADVVINGLPSTETRPVFEEIGRYWRERRTVPIIISLAKGVEAALSPEPHIVTPTQMIHDATNVPIDRILYLGGPNIAAEIYNMEYANARICGSEQWGKPLARFLRQPHFMVWENPDLVTHEVMGGLKNVYAIGAGMVAALTNESATSKSVYFAHCTSEMVFITHLLTEEPEKLAGPLLADTYVTLLKGRNAWYGQKVAQGELRPDMGDSFQGKGTIQGVSAVEAFYELLRQPSLSVMHPEDHKMVIPVELCPILQTLYRILIRREATSEAILEALRDENMYDPRRRIEIAQNKGFYLPQLLGSPRVLHQK